MNGASSHSFQSLSDGYGKDSWNVYFMGEKIPGASFYSLQYSDFDVKFHSQFDWGRGGKVGFGFGIGIGNGNTGCKIPTDGAGGSFCLVWYCHHPGTS
ncbi:unnamed protein product [Rotaria sp. Silwood2]|nr:unnamed protein product [Rotaria sp. Silwood2]CAF4037775.1 unnamed protein product [Rotaria sp. Silwood2]